jgi:hypothetical protein
LKVVHRKYIVAEMKCDIIRRIVGRPKKQRRKDGNEAAFSGGKLKRTYNEWTCSNSSMKGHSRRRYLIFRKFEGDN